MNRLKSFLLASAAATLACAPAHAQDTQAAQTQTGQATLGEIVVQARKFAEDIQVTPIAVTAINQEAIENRFADDLTDLSGAAPNVILDSGGAFAGTAFFSIRGISFQDVESSFDPAVGVSIDGVFIGRNVGSLIDFFDVEQVEILRGPQGTLFGRNTIGGTINVRSARPSGEFGVKGQLTVGNVGRLDVKAALDMPIVADKFAAKVSVFSQNADGFHKNLFDGTDARKENTDSARLSLRFTPTEKLTIDVIGDYARDRSGSFGLVPQHSTGLTFSPGLDAADVAAVNAAIGALPAPLQGVARPSISVIALAQILQGAAPTLPNIIAGLTPANLNILQRWPAHPYDNSFNAPNINRINSGGVTANIVYDMDSGTFTSTTGWRKVSEDVVQDFDATASPLFETFRDQQQEQISQELNFSSDFGGSPFKLTSGVYYFWQKYNLQQNFLSLFQTPLGGLGPFNWASILPPRGILNNVTEQTSRSTAVYAEGTYNFSDMVALTVGARYTWDKKKFQTDLAGAATAPLCAASPLSGPGAPRQLCSDEESWNEFTPRGILQFTPNDDIMVYGSVSRGYKSGGFNGRASTPTSIGPFDPEKVTSYEAGVKTTLLDNRVRFNVTGFINDYSNLQVEIVRPAPGASGQETIVLNAADAKTQGIEVEFVAAPASGFTVNAALGYLDAKYKNFTQPVLLDLSLAGLGQVPVAGVTEDLTVFKMRRAPKWTISVGGRYETEVMDRLDLGLQLDFRHTSEMFTTVRNQEFGRRRAVGLLNGSIDLTYDKNYKLSLFGKNLTDEKYVNSALSIGDSPLAYQGNVGGFTSFAAGREYGLQLSLSF